MNIIEELSAKLELAADEGYNSIVNGNSYIQELSDKVFSTIVPCGLEDSVISAMFNSGTWERSSTGFYRKPIR